MKNASILFLLFTAILTAEEGEVFDYIQLGKVPTVKVEAKPCYPDSAFKERTEGAVLIDIVIDEEGKVISAKVFESQPAGVFDEVALEAAWKCTFEPMTFEEKPVKVAYRMPFLFGRDQYSLKRCSKVKK